MANDQSIPHSKISGNDDDDEIQRQSVRIDRIVSGKGLKKKGQTLVAQMDEYAEGTWWW